jgi:hypothetical protein
MALLLAHLCSNNQSREHPTLLSALVLALVSIIMFTLTLTAPSCISLHICSSCCGSCTLTLAVHCTSMCATLSPCLTGRGILCCPSSPPSSRSCQMLSVRSLLGCSLQLKKRKPNTSRVEQLHNNNLMLQSLTQGNLERCSWESTRVRMGSPSHIKLEKTRERQVSRIDDNLVCS